jgi:formate-dependent phosphoribosylglycinamide formyltransferase (GAR transformylase)
MCVEFFVTKKNELLVNEIAPRVHNSGHLTMNAHDVSSSNFAIVFLSSEIQIYKSPINLTVLMMLGEWYKIELDAPKKQNGI